MDDELWMTPHFFSVFLQKTSPILLRSESKADPGHPQRHLFQQNKRCSLWPFRPAKMGWFHKNLVMISQRSWNYTANMVDVDNLTNLYGRRWQFDQPLWQDHLTCWDGASDHPPVPAEEKTSRWMGIWMGRARKPCLMTRGYFAKVLILHHQRY